MKLQYNEEDFFCTKTELLDFRLTLPLAKLVMIEGRLVSNGLIISGESEADIHSVIFLLLPNVIELSIGAKLKKIDNHRYL